MHTHYPRFSQVLRVALPAILLAHFVVWPTVGFLSLHAGIIAAECTLLWFVVLYIRRQRLIAEDLLLLNAAPAATLLLTIPVAVCCSLVIAELDLYLAQLLGRMDLSMPLSFQKNLLEIQVVRGLADIPKGLVIIVLVPVICEEPLFRGLVFTSLYAHRGPRWALGGSALLFAVSHFNPWQLIPLFLFGLFLGALVHWTHSIYPAMLAHAVNNLASMTGVNLRTYLGLDGLGPSQHLPVPLVLLAGLILLGGLLLLSRQSAVMPLLVKREFSQPDS